ncbi:probable serine/threonine-protein kinase DDB_G0282963 [Episyrphus balteatus]|uniref:probable serine/threonine-protein kinase DDB_G0282963 n=1 Tax=Episyrphus balteatus TaxID=286459 RepID=UPI002486523E|nr:probable serine/threonine-protein kinase DDB_G0282963 [Episyrphus balteatus]
MFEFEKMQEFDLYEDLELLHVKEKQEAIDDLRWKDKYEVALSTIQKLQTEKKELNKKIKQLEINFANLLDTARTEIKRKDNQICDLRKQKDDICFRRFKPQNGGKQFTENAEVHREDTSSDSAKVNPFSRVPRKIEKNNSDTESLRKHLDDQFPLATFSKEKLANGKPNFDRNKYRDEVRRSDSREKDHSRNRHRDRSKDRDRSRDRSRYQHRSRDKEDERGRHRFNDRSDNKEKDHKSNWSKERPSGRDKDERSKDDKRKGHDRDRSQTKSSDGSWDKYDKIDHRSQRTNHTDGRHTNTTVNGYESSKNLDSKPKDAIHTKKDQIKDSKTEHHKLKKNVPNSPTEKRPINQKIEILQIEILKDVKEFKKNKKEAKKIQKLPETIDPNKLATEKSNQFIDALFDDSIINQSEEPNDNDLYDDILVTNAQKIDSIPNDNVKENLVKTDENCNLNIQTPKRQPLSFDELFGPSPAGSLCSVVGRENPIKSVGGSSSDSDFVLIEKPLEDKRTELVKAATVEQIIIDDKDEKHSKLISPTKPLTVSKSSGEKTGKEKVSNNGVVAFPIPAKDKHLPKTDENFNLKYQTPQKQPLTKVMDDLFGPSPATSICGSKNVFVESSDNVYFVPIEKSVNSKTNETAKKTTPIKLSLVVDDSSCDDVITKETKEEKQHLIPDLANKNTNDAKTFKFVELDSSFYSSEDEINEISKDNLNMSRDEIESPPFEDLTDTPSKISETELMVKNKSTSNSSEKLCSEGISNISSKSDETLLKPNITNDGTLDGKCKDALKYQTKMDNIEQSHNSLSPKNSSQTSTKHNKEEICKKYNSKKRHITSHNFNSISASEENLHRSSSSRRSREKHHHHRRHHENRSKESTRSKNESSPHKDSHSSRKHSKHNRNRSTQNRNETKTNTSKENSDKVTMKNDISEARLSPMLRFDDNDDQNEKITDQDQVFFLHCDDISDDDEIIGNSFDNKDTDESKKVERIVLKSNVIELDLISPEKNSINNEVESNQRVMSLDVVSVLPSTHENGTEVDMEIECNKISVDTEPQDKVLASMHSSTVSNEKSSTEIDINPSNIEETDTENKMTTTKSEEICQDKNTSAVSSDLQLSELKNQEQKSENRADCPNLIPFESCKNEQIAKENLIVSAVDENITLNDHGLAFVEDVIKEQINHKNYEETDVPVLNESSQSSIHHVEIDQKMNLQEKDEPSGDKIEKIIEKCSPNTAQEKASSEKVLINEKSGSDDKSQTSLETKPTSENSSDRQVEDTEISKSISDEQNTPKCTSPYYNKSQIKINELNKISSIVPNDTAPTKTISSPLKKSEISNQAIDSRTIQSSSNSSPKIFSSHISPQKSLNSTDEFESSPPNCESISSGRRKKIKTPKKRTDDSNNPTNSTMTMVSDRYIKSDDNNHSFISTPFNSNGISSDDLSEIIGKDKHQKDVKEPENILEPLFPKENCQNGSDCNNKIMTEKLNCNLESKNETDEVEDKDNNEPESRKNNISSSIFDESLEKEDFSKTKNDSFVSPSKSLLSTKDEDCLQTCLPTLSSVENVSKNTEHISPIKSDKIEKLQQEKSTMLEEVDKEEIQKDVPSYADDCLLSSELSLEQNKEEKQINENVVESYSITIKRNRCKRKTAIKNSTDSSDTKIMSSNEIVNNENNTFFPGERLNDNNDEMNNLNIERNHKRDTIEIIENKNNQINDMEWDFYAQDKPCCSSSIKNKTLKSRSTKRNNQRDSSKNQQQIVKQSLDSKNELVEGANNYQSLLYCDEVLDSKSEETNTNTKKRKRKLKTQNNSTTETSSPDCEITKTKRKYKRKPRQILDSSISNEDDKLVNDSIIEESKIISTEVLEDFKSPDLKESTKKRKNKKRNSNSSIDSKNKSTELSKSFECPEMVSSLNQIESGKNVENIVDKLHSSQETSEIIQESRQCSQNETEDIQSIHIAPEKALEENCDKIEKLNNEIDFCLNNSSPAEESKKTKRQRKRKLSRSSDGKLEEPILTPKRSRKNHKNKCQKQSPSHETSTNSMNALTPTHHKIFLNDVFSNDPPPVYNANDDDLQYHEIDDRLRSMFQSPSYTQSSNGECTNNDQTDSTSCNNDNNVTVDETLNQSELPTQCDTSTSSRKVSLGSNEYVIESVGSHTANVFITRKRCKKRTKIVAAVAV